MLVPDKLMTAEPAFILRVQNAMCAYISDEEHRTHYPINGCGGIECKLCILDADLPVFSKWLIKQLEESMK